ncbi:MAG: peptide chain release factor subunit 1 [Gaiellaceae bacterium]|jgi:peptide chain release factor subunit 1|nr:peptide chain release factor subunit 1 [Gaiellaceae bacterium]
MAANVTWSTLRELASFRAEKGCAISLYVNLDPSEAPTPSDVHSHVNSLLDEAERSKAVARAELTHEERASLKADFERLAHFFVEDFDRDGAKGFALFVCGLGNFWRALPLAEPMRDGVRVGRSFYIAPLAPLVGRGDGAIVAVVGREQGTVYRLTAGRLEEIVDRTDDTPGQHDQGGWSQARYQRHIDHLVAEHLKGVAEAIDQRHRRLGAPKIVLVCAEEMRTEFLDRLSKEAREAVVGWTQADAHAAPSALLEVVTPILEEARAKDETETLERWREEAGRNGRAASGWADSLEAASDGRVDVLLFQEGADHAAFECPACGRATLQDGACPLDGTRLEPNPAGVDLALHRTFAHGGTVVTIRHSRDLDPVEGIGALLRF